MKHAVISLSGGMDSATLLLHLIHEKYAITALTFDYGQKHKVEILRATELVQYLNSKGHNINHHIIKLDGLTDLLQSSLTTDGIETPEGHYEEDTMKLTVVPNRNKIFSSIIQAAALSISNKYNTDTVIAMGIHAGDHAIYPDCRQEFRDADELAFRQGNWEHQRVEYYTPYLESNKTQILLEGNLLCKILDIDFNEYYARTNTSYKPIFRDGKWYSDYKSSSSVERIEAFISLDLKDPVEYHNGNTPETWDNVVNHVKTLLNE